MTVMFRPLGKVREIVQSTGLDISYAYDDLVFSDHSLLVIQFDDKVETNIFLYFNVDCEEGEAKRLESTLHKASKTEGFTIKNKGTFSVDQVEGEENLKVTFY